MTRQTADDQLAGSIGRLVGGPDNVKWVGSCTTRLRFEVRDEKRVDFDALNTTTGVLTAVSAGGQVQVVIGTHVDDVRRDLLREPEWSRFDGETAPAADAASGARRTPLDVAFDFLGATFQPIIPVITGAALVQVISLLLTQAGVLEAGSPTAAVLSATGNAVFYFLPIFVAFTATRRLGANPFVGAAIAAALLHPDFTAIGQTGDVASAFGIPLFMYSYASSMFPALLLSLALAGLDRLLKRGIPNALQQVVVPTLELLLLVPLTALVFGPVGVLIGNGIGAGTQWLSAEAPFLFYLILPVLWILLVSFGIHWALISIGLAEIAAGGGSPIFGAAVGYQYVILGVALGVLIRALRDRGSERSLRDTAATAALAVGIGGITEPAVYGIVLRYRRVLVIELVSAAAVGVVLGLFQSQMVGFAPAPILGLPLNQPFAGAIIAFAAGVLLPIVLLQVFGYEKAPSRTADVASSTASEVRPAVDTAGFQGVVDAEASPAEVTVYSPARGTVLPLAQTGDPIFAEGLIGPGVGLVPAGSRVVAPLDGTVIAAPPSGHAIGLRTDAGLELLVHVGIDTVRMNGVPFTLRVAAGDVVTAGQVLVEFDRAAIEAAGYSLTTPIVVANAASDQRVDVVADGTVEEGQPLYVVRTAAH
ncbi:glucose PTS transporter subunit IIA [Rathayibacter sp. Leaf296]|uniref:glucose PTS transporter subunit IIA n=1 Tax=Rathayibacter sp. Leaf296 TaxID=1736327 RepID=UPI0007039226|nr:glucose PTS transporter subunit IIA [Rathayibacter sp. Leaf296]KQQ08500.1 hypothetical protein ASF46_14470 [Rathayibacter sp. Leaf296]